MSWQVEAVSCDVGCDSLMGQSIRHRAIAWPYRFHLAGVKDRATNQVSTKVVSDTKKPTLQGIDRPHNAVRHSAGEYVRDMARTNGIESTGHCSSAGLLALTTISAQSIWTDTQLNSRGGITPDLMTRLTRFRE